MANNFLVIPGEGEIPLRIFNAALTGAISEKNGVYVTLTHEKGADKLYFTTAVSLEPGLTIKQAILSFLEMQIPQRPARQP